jgi:hypothetical protein
MGTPQNSDRGSPDAVTTGTACMGSGSYDALPPAATGSPAVVAETVAATTGSGGPSDTAG